jgi:hypothetical protein
VPCSKCGCAMKVNSDSAAPPTACIKCSSEVAPDHAVCGHGGNNFIVNLYARLTSDKAARRFHIAGLIAAIYLKAKS